MQTNRSTMTTRKRLKIAERLSLFQHTKRKRLVWQRDGYGVIGGYLDEDAASGSTLVQLAGGMQKAWSVAGSRCYSKSIAKVSTNRLEQRLVFGRLLYVVEQSYV